MTMVNVFFKIPIGHGISVEEIEEAISESPIGCWEVEEVPEFNGEIGLKGCNGIKVYTHISYVADLVEMMEQGIGAELMVAW